MRDRVKELKARGKAGKSDGARDILAKIAEMGPDDAAIAKRLHEIVTRTAPSLVPRTWYGMPAYSKDDDVLCFFQPAGKFGARYGTLGFNDGATLDEGNMWPTGFALSKLTDVEEAKIVTLLRKALG